MKMVTIKLMGGLGNQLFQYATGRKLSYNNAILNLDTSYYKSQPPGTTPRHYSLGDFNIQASLNLPSENSKEIKERSFEFDNSILGFSGSEENLYLNGYWQSEKYFSDIREILLNDLTIKNYTPGVIKINKNILNENSISIHIRRGDYVSDKKTNDFHGVCDEKYYKKAIDYLLGLKKINNPKFYIFSDDINWAKKIFSGMNSIEYIHDVCNAKDTEELVLMSHCKHNIIANSTFSWWAAWLNQYKDKIIIAPKEWFKSKKINTKDLLPKEWIIV